MNGSNASNAERMLRRGVRGRSLEFRRRAFPASPSFSDAAVTVIAPRMVRPIMVSTTFDEGVAHPSYWIPFPRFARKTYCIADGDGDREGTAGDPNAQTIQ